MISIFSHDIAMEFGIKECAILMILKGKNRIHSRRKLLKIFNEKIHRNLEVTEAGMNKNRMK